MSDTSKREYIFTDAEIRCLALLFRKYEAILDSDLDSLRHFVDEYMYGIMTIEEAEHFFNET